MRFKDIMKECGLEGSKSYQIVGDIMIIKAKPISDDWIDCIMKYYPYINTICRIKKIVGEFRKPDIEVLWSRKDNPTLTIHKEWGILYKIDVSKVMFSKGNLLERGRILKIVKPGEKVLDMFAGIGYFTIPAAKAGGIVTAVEKNIDSFNLLLENISLNKVDDKVSVVLSDNREFFGGKYDRIIMGYFPGTEKFLETARRFSHEKTIIHYHNTYMLHEIPSKIEDEIKRVFPEAKILHMRRVKKAGPSKIHIVVDFVVS